MTIANGLEAAAPRSAGSIAADKWLPSVYFVMGQAGWFACVLSAAKGHSWWGIAFAALLAMLHALRAARPLEEVKLMLAVMLMGGLWESTLIYLGLLQYPGSPASVGLAPAWLLALWGLFAAQVNTTYRWLKPRIGLAALLGAIAGPLSFRAGAALGALRFAKPWPAAAALMIGWAVLLPLVVMLSRRWDGLSPTVASAG
jgi:hypothetical protein